MALPPPHLERIPVAKRNCFSALIAIRFFPTHEINHLASHYLRILEPAIFDARWHGPCMNSSVRGLCRSQAFATQVSRNCVHALQYYTLVYY